MVGRCGEGRESEGLRQRWQWDVCYANGGWAGGLWRVCGAV